jgi:hypothetical protein
MKQDSLVDAAIIEAPTRNRSLAGTIRCRIVRLNTEAGIVWIAFPPLPLVAGLGTAFFTGSLTRPGRWRAVSFFLSIHSR